MFHLPIPCVSCRVHARNMKMNRDLVGHAMVCLVVYSIAAIPLCTVPLHFLIPVTDRNLLTNVWVPSRNGSTLVVRPTRHSWK
jgi:hypothetical protein